MRDFKVRDLMVKLRQQRGDETDGCMATKPRTHWIGGVEDVAAPRIAELRQLLQAELATQIRGQGGYRADKHVDVARIETLECVHSPGHTHHRINGFDDPGAQQLCELKSLLHCALGQIGAF